MMIYHTITARIVVKPTDVPIMRDAIQKMVNVAQGMEADTLPEIDE